MVMPDHVVPTLEWKVSARHFVRSCQIEGFRTPASEDKNMYKRLAGDWYRPFVCTFIRSTHSSRLP